MKKSALLAVSALSLGVVGLATFTPVVSAVTSMTGDATVTVNVDPQLAIGDQPLTPGQEDQEDNDAFNALSVDFSTVAANAVASEQTKNVAIQNNSGKGGALTISAADANLTNVDGVHKIPSTATAPAAGTSTWGVKSDMSGGTAGAWKAVSSSPVTLGTDTGEGQTSYEVIYGLSTSASQVSGKYNGSVTYTYTIQDLSA